MDQNQSQDDLTQIVSNIPDVKQPAKRGRKPKNPEKEPQKEKNVKKKEQCSRIFSVTDPNSDHTSQDINDHNVILKLNITPPSNGNSSKDMDFNKNDPGAYNFKDEDTFKSTPLELIKEEQLVIDDKKAKVVHLLKDFEQKSKNNEWPSTTQISCYWCCHQFDNPPFGIPIKFIDTKYYVFGCFCSLECAAAYNFSSKESVDEIWEQYNLINQLSQEIGHKNKIKPAPHRLALTMFGGHMKIDEFRQFCYTSKILNINFPPMMTITQQIEEVNESDINTEYKYVPIDVERINRYKEKIKLKRSRPLTDNENTLDHIIQKNSNNV